MKFTWKPIKDINNLPRGVELMVCIKNNYCEYIRRGIQQVIHQMLGFMYIHKNKYKNIK